ncbi:hypothetical protein EDD16DRAFT_216338 [Pisolithus croceorrhizus]|nr:hypothetical protein EDD16DRAFT_216338 [Pisolithus croceorrhizus]
MPITSAKHIPRSGHVRSRAHQPLVDCQGTEATHLELFTRAFTVLHWKEKAHLSTILLYAYCTAFLNKEGTHPRASQVNEHSHLHQVRTCPHHRPCPSKIDTMSRRNNPNSNAEYGLPLWSPVRRRRTVACGYHLSRSNRVRIHSFTVVDTSSPLPNPSNLRVGETSELIQVRRVLATDIQRKVRGNQRGASADVSCGYWQFDIVFRLGHPP